MALVPAKVSKQNNNPHSYVCCACKNPFPARDMVKVKRQWYCTTQAVTNAGMTVLNPNSVGCKERMEKYGLWPPMERQKED